MNNNNFILGDTVKVKNIIDESVIYGFFCSEKTNIYLVFVRGKNKTLFVMDCFKQHRYVSIVKCKSLLTEKKLNTCKALKEYKDVLLHLDMLGY